MLTLSVVFGILAFGVFSYLVLVFLGEWKLRTKMKEKAAQFEAQGMRPSGASLSHGMCINKTTKKVVHDQMESTVWYKRLMD